MIKRPYGPIVWHACLDPLMVLIPSEKTVRCRRAMRDASELVLVMGVITGPASKTRALLRTTWMKDSAQAHTLVRFVLGSLNTSACGHVSVEALAAEESEHKDVVHLHDVPDCSKWHSPLKVHAWYQHALAHLPPAPWLGKMEDDGMVRLRPLAQMLGVLSAQLPTVGYVGNMQWQASCTLVSSEQSTCAGCWGGYFRAQRFCREVDSFGTKHGAGTAECPAINTAPFACGPLELRSRALARRLARCEYAERQFRWASAQSDRQGLMCTSTDGGQGHAIGHCLRSVEVLDLGTVAQSYPVAGFVNRTGTLVAHPLKHPSGAFWRSVWAQLSGGQPYVPVQPPRAEVTGMVTGMVADQRSNASAHRSGLMRSARLPLPLEVLRAMQELPPPPSPPSPPPPPPPPRKDPRAWALSYT